MQTDKCLSLQLSQNCEVKWLSYTSEFSIYTYLILKHCDTLPLIYIATWKIQGRKYMN